MICVTRQETSPKSGIEDFGRPDHAGLRGDRMRRHVEQILKVVKIQQIW